MVCLPRTRSTPGMRLMPKLNVELHRLPSLQNLPKLEKSDNSTPYSEHGHSFRRIQPMTKHGSRSVGSWFKGLFATIIAVSSLGASITFSYVIGNINTPVAGNHFGVADVQFFLGLSWLLFLLALASASLGSTLLNFFQEHWKLDWDGHNGKKSQRSVQLYATFAFALLGALVIAAFVFLCLVVTAYTPVIGWMALGFTGLFGLVIALGVCMQAPWPWQDNTPRLNGA